MNRHRFLSLIGLTFIGPLFLSTTRKSTAVQFTDCDNPITPPVPEGPFYKREQLNRVDIRENKKGTPISYIFTVEDKHCKPVAGAVVDIWQCDNEGHYSDFKEENTINQTWLRGYQVTDKNGECRFKSIFPGWYTGRITHLHVKVKVNDTNVLTTNCFFPKEIETDVYKSPLYPKGINLASLADDFELRGDKDAKRHDTLVMQVQKDDQGSLIASYTIAVM